MSIAIPINKFILTPGSQITIADLSWSDFEQILDELGEDRNTRIAYYRGMLEIICPLARHERYHRIIADIVKTILDCQNRHWEDFGSTTLKQPQIAGIEPDTCFYIENALLVRGCNYLDLSQYPPPDLAIESDVTSNTSIQAYAGVGVREVWIYSDSKLEIYVLESNGYVQRDISTIFPNLPLIEIIPTLINKAIAFGTNQMLRELKSQLLE